ncbi:hypothetical protein GY45DRAFT_528899 [Cubamyces sp. BRFM 1775]|nr:hypothetical protein GY45DRAFT_528899 [Cubamyces sp. BRFM 1775]
MPLLRCRNYDDNGAPIGRGCMRAECKFVHPSEPAWDRAPRPKMKQPYQNRDSRPRGNDGGWNQRQGGWRDSGDRGYGGGGGGGGGGWDEPSSSAGPSKAPSGSRGRQASGSSTAGWGNDSFAGSGWGAADDTTNTGSNNAAASSSGWGATPSTPSTSTPAAPAASDWGAPAAASGEWGAPTQSGSVEWGAPPAAPVPPSPGAWGVPNDTGGQKSPDQEKKSAEDFIWGDASKGGGSSAGGPTPQWNTGTPLSPQKSPQRERVQSIDPRRRPSTTIATGASGSKSAASAMASPSDDAAASALAKDMRREEVRMLSWGVSAPTSIAGPSGGTSRPNPFAFPEYKPAERMDVVQEAPAGPVRELNMMEAGEESKVNSSATSRVGSPAPPSMPSSATTQWEQYIRALSKAVMLKVELYAMEETRQKLRSWHRSPAYQSASMVNVHTQIEKVRAEHDKKQRQQQKRFDELMERLAKFPVNGPEPAADTAVTPEVQAVMEYVSGVSTWLDSVKPTVETRRKEAEAAIEAKREAEEKARAEAEAREAALEAARAQVESVATQVDDVEEKMADLEHHFDDLRVAPMDLHNVFTRVLAEVAQTLGISVQAIDSSDPASEEGSTPAVAPKTLGQLTEEYEKVKQQVLECAELLERVTQRIEDLKTRNVAKDLVYHQLEIDHGQMQLRFEEVRVVLMHSLNDGQSMCVLMAPRGRRQLSRQRKEDIARIEANRVELERLHGLLAQHKDQELPPPPPAEETDILMAHIMPSFRPALRGELNDALSQMRQGVDEAIRVQEEALCEQVYTTLLPVMRLIQSVTSLTDRQPEILMPPPPPPVQSVQHS